MIQLHSLWNLVERIGYYIRTHLWPDVFVYWFAPHSSQIMHVLSGVVKLRDSTLTLTEFIPVCPKFNPSAVFCQKVNWFATCHLQIFTNLCWIWMYYHNCYMETKKISLFLSIYQKMVCNFVSSPAQRWIVLVLIITHKPVNKPVQKALYTCVV